MKTVFISINELKADYEKNIKKAANIIKQNGLVAFPTETVYGLGANALNKESVKKIYEAKGRPSDNPLIVHIKDKSDIKKLSFYENKKIDMLIDKFWPGPLTLVLEKKDFLPKETLGNLNTVAIRFPDNKIAIDLMKYSDCFLAAPSANTSGKPSPTRANHVLYDLSGKVDMVLDGGSCEFGLESTILDVQNEPFTLLRPGAITKEMIEALVGKIVVDKAIDSKSVDSPKAPGMKYIHYKPAANVTIISGELAKTTEKIIMLAEKELLNNSKIGILATEQTIDLYDKNKFLVLSVGDRQDSKTISHNLFKMLRKFDYYGIDKVFSESFEETFLSMAIMNRLKKAAGYNIIFIE